MRRKKIKYPLLTKKHRTSRFVLLMISLTLFLAAGMIWLIDLIVDPSEEKYPLWTVIFLSCVYGIGGIVTFIIGPICKSLKIRKINEDPKSEMIEKSLEEINLAVRKLQEDVRKQRKFQKLYREIKNLQNENQVQDNIESRRQKALDNGWDEDEMDLDEFEDYFK